MNKYVALDEDVERIKHNIAWQLDRKLITREKAMELVEKAGITHVIGSGYFTRDKSDAEFREMFNPPGPLMDEEELLRQLRELPGLNA